MFVTRLASGVVLVIFAVLICVMGGALQFGVTLVLSLMGMFELYRVLQIEKTPLAYLSYGSAVIYYGILYIGANTLVTPWTVISLIALLFVYVFTFPKYRVEQIAGAFLGIFYVAVLLSYLYLVRSMQDGRYLVWLAFLSSWGTDTCAYCAGRLFGKHKMAPILSPKKTIEGAVGGVIGAALLGGIYAAVFGAKMQELPDPMLICVAACTIAGLISMVGDLAASAIKRNYDVKDYSHLIPGHGGILDRFDSMLFTAPAIYYAVLFLCR